MGSRNFDFSMHSIHLSEPDNEVSRGVCLLIPPITLALSGKVPTEYYLGTYATKLLRLVLRMYLGCTPHVFTRSPPATNSG